MSLNRFTGLSVPEVVDVSHGRSSDDYAKTRNECSVGFIYVPSFCCCCYFGLLCVGVSSELALDALAAMKCVVKIHGCLCMHCFYVSTKRFYSV